MCEIKLARVINRCLEDLDCGLERLLGAGQRSMLENLSDCLKSLVDKLAEALGKLEKLCGKEKGWLFIEAGKNED